MKKSLFCSMLLIFAMAISTACSSTNDAASTNNDNQVEEKKSEPVAEKEEKEVKEEKEEVVEEIKKTVSITEFEELLKTQPVTIESTNYVVQSAEYKSLYPDLLQAIIKNNQQHDIRNATVAFVAWDENGLPVKLKGDIDFYEATYIREINFGDINLVADATVGEDSGFGLDSSIKLHNFKAIIVDCETFDGTMWVNPYYDEFKTLYEGNKYKDDLTVEIIVEDVPLVVEEGNVEEASMTVDELEKLLSEQPMFVESTNYAVQSEEYKSLYPDMLQAIIKNNSEEDIRDAVVAFVAWDKNGLPVKLKGDIDFNEATYIREISYGEINLISGATFGDDAGYQIADGLNIDSFKAIVISYETFDDKQWKNPYYEDFVKLYGNKKLVK